MTKFAGGMASDDAAELGALAAAFAARTLPLPVFAKGATRLAGRDAFVDAVQALLVRTQHRSTAHHFAAAHRDASYCMWLSTLPAQLTRLSQVLGDASAAS